MLALVSVLLASPVMAQDAVTSSQFDQIARDAALGDVAWRIDNVNAGTKGPLIVWLPGSGA